MRVMLNNFKSRAIGPSELLRMTDRAELAGMTDRAELLRMTDRAELAGMTDRAELVGMTNATNPQPLFVQNTFPTAI